MSFDGPTLQNPVAEDFSATSVTYRRPLEAGFPALSVYRKVLGLHGTMVTVSALGFSYDASRDQVRATRSITEIFERIYPVLASTHETEIYEEDRVKGSPCRK